MTSSSFFAPDLNIFLQIFVQTLILLTYAALIFRGIKNPRFLFISIFYFWNLIFVIPFFFSISSGNYGYSARMAAVPRTDPFVLSLYLLQIILPVIVLEIIAKVGRVKSLTMKYRWKQSSALNGTIVFVLILYILAFFLQENSPLFLALDGDIEAALEGRVAIRVAGGGEAFGFIFKFHRLISQFALIWIAFYIISVKKRNKLLLLPVFLLAGFSDFSKGGLAYAIMLLSICLFFSSARLQQTQDFFKNLKIIFVGFSATLLSLIGYMKLTAGIDFYSASVFIARRLYNHTSSVYGQIDRFADRAPLGWSVADFGFITRLAQVETFVPKAAVYPLIFGRDGGQAGSMMSSELFFFAGNLFPVVMIFILAVLGLLMMSMNSAVLNTDKSKTANRLFIPFAVYLGVVLPLYALWQPFKVFSVFTILRLEIILTLALLLILFKITMKRRVL